MHKIKFRWIHDAGRSSCEGTHTVTVLDPAKASQQARLEIEAKMAFPPGTVRLVKVPDYDHQKR